MQKREQNCTGFGEEGVLVQKKILFYTEKGLLGENGAEKGAKWHRIQRRRSFGAEKGAEWHRSGAGKVPERGVQMICREEKENFEDYDYKGD